MLSQRHHGIHLYGYWYIKWTRFDFGQCTRPYSHAGVVNNDQMGIEGGDKKHSSTHT